MILFPAIDLKDGACVRLVRGDMASATAAADARRSAARPVVNAAFPAISLACPAFSAAYLRPHWALPNSEQPFTAGNADGHRKSQQQQAKRSERGVHTKTERAM